MESTALITLDHVVRMAQAKAGEETLRYYPAMLLYGEAFLTEYRADTGMELLTVQLAIARDRTVELPADYIDWCRIAQQRGQFYEPLAFNPALSLDPDPDADGPSLGDAARNRAAEFTFDRFQRLIRLSLAVDADRPLVLQYHAASDRKDRRTLVHPWASMCCQYYVAWQFHQLHKRGTPARAPKLEQLYYRERDLMKSRFDPTTLADVEDARNSTISQAPRH